MPTDPYGPTDPAKRHSAAITDGPDRALIAGGADSHASMARWLLLIDRPITVIGPPELAAAFVAVAAEAARAGLAAAGSPASAPANLADA